MSTPDHLVAAWCHERPFLLGHRQWHGVPVQDREDALQRAVMELLAREFKSVRHARNTLALRYHARIHDLLRVKGGRSSDAIHFTVLLEPDQHITYIDPERTLIGRETLQRLCGQLDARQRGRLVDTTARPVTLRKRRERARAALRMAA
jgi:hypothetical protein